MSTRKWLWRWRRNELKRRSDRIEAWVVLAAGAILAGSVPVTGSLASDAAADSLRAHSGLRQAPAVVLADAPSTDGIATVTTNPTVPTEVRWKLADGSSHKGEAPVLAGTPKRTEVTVWLDGHGKPKPPPPGPAQAAGESFAAGTAAVGGTCFATFACYWVVKRRIDASRAREWEREWAAVGPRWSRRN